MSLAVDGSSPAIATSSTVTNTSASFTAPAGARLVAFIGHNTSGTTVTDHSISDTGGLTWTLVGRKSANTGSTDGIGYTTTGVEIWTAVTATSAARTVSVTSGGTAGFQQSLDIKVFTDSGGTPAMGTVHGSSSSSGLPTATLTTTAANSWVWSVNSDNNGAGAGTAGTGQTLSAGDEGLLGAYISIHTWRQTAVTPASGTSVTNNLTAPTQQYNMLIVEIKPFAAGATPFTGWGIPA